MKKQGAIIDFKIERDDAIMRAYRCEVMRAGEARMWEICVAICQQAQPRFWVSEERATKVVLMMLRKPQKFEQMRSARQRLFAEIFRRYEAMHAERPEASVAEIVREVVYEPAPELYLEPNAVKDIIYARIMAERKARRLAMAMRNANKSDCYARG